MADNTNLQRVVSRRFDIAINNKYDVILIDHTNPDEIIKDPQEAIKIFLSKEFPEIKNIKSEEEALPKELTNSLKSKDLLQ